MMVTIRISFLVLPITAYFLPVVASEKARYTQLVVLHRLSRRQRQNLSVSLSTKTPRIYIARLLKWLH